MKKKEDKNVKQYWMCIIGGVTKDKLGWGADWPLRQAVRDQYLETFDEPDDVCASGWGIDEERYELLRSIHLKSTEDLKKMLKSLKKC